MRRPGENPHTIMEDSKSIIEKVFQLYDKLPACGKPREDEYTVLAAVIAETGAGIKVVALTSGTKCIGPDCVNEKGCLLSDSHGEVLARRCFVRYLSDWIITIIENPSAASAVDCPVQWNTDTTEQSNYITIKDSWKFSLYISDSPCGDASIYASNLIEENGVNQTGAKLVSTTETTSGEKLGSLRTKSGRNDIKVENRTTSMSCSDKVCRWICLGLQGALLSLWIAPVRLNSLIVDQDPSSTEEAQRNALLRALKDRILFEAEINQEEQERTDSSDPPTAKHSFSDIPSVCIAPVETGFPRGKAAAKFAHPITEASTATTTAETEESAEATEPAAKRRKKNPLSPCGASVNWYLSSPATLRALATVTAATAITTSTDDATPLAALSPPLKETLQAGTSAACFNHKDSSTRVLKPRKVTEVAGGTVEVMIAHTGALQGSVKKCVGEISTASRLSPHAMRTLFEHTVQVLQVHRDASEIHRSLYKHIAKTLLNDSSGAVSSLPFEEEGLSATSISKTQCTEPLLPSIQLLTRRELKQRCGKCYYNQAKAQFLCHPVFKDWICDE